jgi:hypothetical protein
LKKVIIGSLEDGGLVYVAGQGDHPNQYRINDDPVLEKLLKDTFKLDKHIQLEGINKFLSEDIIEESVSIGQKQLATEERIRKALTAMVNGKISADKVTVTHTLVDDYSKNQSNNFSIAIEIPEDRRKFLRGVEEVLENQFGTKRLSPKQNHFNAHGEYIINVDGGKKLDTMLQECGSMISDKDNILDKYKTTTNAKIIKMGGK